MFGLDIFWNDKKIDELIEKHNTVFESFLKVVKANALSIFIVLLIAGVNKFFGPKIDTNVEFILIYANFFVWFYALILAGFVFWFIKRKKIENKNKDAIADFLVVVNTMNQKYLYLNIFLLTLLTITTTTILLVNSFSQILVLILSFLNSLILHLTPIIGVVFFILTLRIQFKTMQKLFKIGPIMSIIILVSSIFYATIILHILFVSYIIIRLLTLQ
ncbi:MAG: hypothetical protein Q7K42_01665 [Candidatus Diapherotrites archaeon]|nr:hypothetical protein [Candidatus Diapherotrites archaeon]